MGGHGGIKAPLAEVDVPPCGVGPGPHVLGGAEGAGIRVEADAGEVRPQPLAILALTSSGVRAPWAAEASRSASRSASGIWWSRKCCRILSCISSSSREPMPDAWASAPSPGAACRPWEAGAAACVWSCAVLRRAV